MVDQPVLRQLTESWSIRLDSSFRARVDGKNLVFFLPGRTLLISVWNNPQGQPPEERLKTLKTFANPTPVEKYEPSHPSLSRYAYLLLESDDKKGVRWALYAFTLA